MYCESRNPSNGGYNQILGLNGTEMSMGIYSTYKGCWSNGTRLNYSNGLNNTGKWYTYRITVSNGDITVEIIDNGSVYYSYQFNYEFSTNITPKIIIDMCPSVHYFRNIKITAL